MADAHTQNPNDNKRKQSVIGVAFEIMIMVMLGFEVAHQEIF